MITSRARLILGNVVYNKVHELIKNCILKYLAFAVKLVLCL